jgi:hypothetical protein
MAVVDLPSTPAFGAARLSLSVAVSASGFVGFFTGNRQRRSNLADRWRASLVLAPCKAAAAAEREAFIFSLASRGDYLRCGMPHQRVRGTLSGAVAVAANTAAGARTLPLTALAGAKIAAGDWLSVAGNLLQCGPGGAVANGSGALQVPLTLPLQRAATGGAVVEYRAPTGLWELDDAGLQLDYSAPIIQGGVALQLLQVVL